MSLRSREARFAVYLVDPGSNRTGLLVFLQEILGVDTAGAAEYLKEYPSLISFCETEKAAKNLAARFSDFDAVAVVRPADQPLAPAPVQALEDVSPVQRVIQVILFVLGIMQLGICTIWLREGRVAAAFFGFLLGVYVIAYFGIRIRKR
jgi:hypothetical protein